MNNFTRHGRENTKRYGRDEQDESASY